MLYAITDDARAAWWF